MSSQLKILVPGDTHVVDLVGQRDELLKLIEASFSSDILVRGNEITITGPQDEAQKVAVVFEELLTLLQKGHTLTTDSVGRAVDMVKSDGEMKPSEVMGEPLLVTRGRAIRPKTSGQKRYVDAIKRNALVFAVGPAGTGKCIAADSLVLTNRGMVEIGSLAGKANPDRYEPLELTVHGLEGRERASHVYDGGETATLRVTTRFGYSIETTPEHPLLTISRSGDLVWRRADELRPGDTLALQRGQRMFGTCTDVNFAYVPVQARGDKSKPVLLDAIDPDFAYFLGILVGDGCLTFRNRVIISSADEVMVEAFYSTARRLGLHVFPNRPFDHVIASSQLYQLLQHLGMSMGPARTKRIPHSVLAAPEAVVAAFLRGLFDADGSVERRDGVITFSSVSDSLMRQVQVVLLNFGIVGSRTRKRGRYLGEPHFSHLLTIAGVEADRFAEVIGFGLERKRALLKTAVRNTNVDVVPGISDLMATAKRSTRLSRAEHKLFLDYGSGRRRPSYDKLDRFVELLDARGATGDAFDRLRDLSRRRLLLLEVKGIRPSRGRVVDLTVPATHSFVANGFVNHNTYLAVAMAVKALRDKEVSRIILTRPAVEAGERLGFLPGDIAQKVDPYLKPLYDALYEMLEPEHFARLMERGTIEVAPLAYMRGRTLNDSFIILDEAQNTTPEQMKMFLTRMGLRSKAVVTGDVTQIDLPEGAMSGLIVVEQILRGIESLEFVHLEAYDVVRHKIVQQIVEAYRRFDEARRAADTR